MNRKKRVQNGNHRVLSILCVLFYCQYYIEIEVIVNNSPAIRAIAETDFKDELLPVSMY